MIITSDDIEGIQELKLFLTQLFEMKDLGFISYFLSFKITLSSYGYYFSQAKYASEFLIRADITDNKIVDTPIENNVKLCDTEGVLLPNATLYIQLVGGIVYLTVTRPDISYAVHLVSFHGCSSFDSFCCGSSYLALY